VLALPVAADVIHLKSGSSVSVDQWWEQDGEIRYRRAGGIIGIPKNQVERIEATATQAPSGIALTDGPRRRSRPSPPAVLAPQAPAPLPGLVPAGGDPEAWLARLRVLEASMGRPGVNEDAVRKEAAILHTLLGNAAARAGDLDAAESRYRLAADNDPDLTAPLLNLARVRMTQGRNSEAEDLIQDALAVRAEEPSALALLAEVAYRSDRLPEAIELWERSLEKRPDGDVAARLAKARKEQDVEQDFYRSDAPHFTLKYDGEKASEALGREILDHLESAYADLTSRFNVYPASVIIVTLYSREAFYDVTESPRWVGGLFDGQIRIPIGGLTRLTAAAGSVFTHELAHCIVYHKTRGNCPRWLQEGIAQRVEGKTARRHDRDLARRYAAATPQDLAGEFSYPLALSLVEHFLETWSVSHLLDLLEALGHGSDLDAAFTSATGSTYESFLASWIRTLPQAGPSPEAAR